MIELSLLSILLLGELMLVLAIAVAALLIGNARRRRRDRQAAMHLVGVIKENEQKRLAAAREFLEKRCSYRGDKLEQGAHDLNKAEKLLYQRVLNTYVKRDVASLRQLNIHVEGVTDAYRSLDLPKGGATPPVQGAVGEELGVSSELVDRLRAENATLKQELQITMETMGRMLSEYAAMFGGGPEAQMDKAQLMGMLADADMEEDEDTATGEAFIEELDIPGREEGSGPETLEELLGTGGQEAVSGDEMAIEELEIPSQEDLSADTGQPLDETVRLEPQPAAAGGDEEIDLAADFDELLAQAEPGQAPTEGEEEEDATADDAELDDIWAEALAEQEAVEKAAEEKKDA